ncbi:hypothetical protein CRUP_027883, partial [Coryphaenoides rupestris]
MFPQGRHPTPHQPPGQAFKFTIPESLDRIKEEFQFLQAQYHSLKLECEKLASEKTEMQRHYVMHQQQVVQAVERAKQVTMAELNAVIGVRGLPGLPPTEEMLPVQTRDVFRSSNSQGVLLLLVLVLVVVTPHQPPGQAFKFTIPESLDRIKEEFQFLQAQYHSLKLECEKLASEKTEMQRHYVMYYEMSYGLNIEMHKQHLSHVHAAAAGGSGGAPVPITPHPAGLHPSQLGGSVGLLALSGALGAMPPHHLASKDGGGGGSAGGDKKPHPSEPHPHPAGAEHLR